MRVLFSCPGQTGEFNVIAPVAAAASAAGHDVVVAAPPWLLPVVRHRGLVAHSTGLDLTGAVVGNLLIDSAVSKQSDLDWDLERSFLGFGCQAFAEDILEFSRQWEPDLIVRNALEFGGYLAAEVLRVPHVSVYPTPELNRALRERFPAHLSRLRRSFGLAPDPGVERPFRYLEISGFPWTFYGEDRSWAPTAHAVNLGLHGLLDEGKVTSYEWLERLPDRTTVLTSLGTSFYDTPGVVDSILSGLRSEPINLVVTRGFEAAVPTLGSVEANIVMFNGAPPWTILSHCSAYLTHGGANSVRESMLFGVPLLVVPLTRPQHSVADRCVAMGIGVQIDADITPDRVRDGLRAVLDEPRFRAAARRAQDDLLALPDITYAVSLLEQIAAKGWSGREALESSTRPTGNLRPARGARGKGSNLGG